MTSWLGGVALDVGRFLRDAILSAAIGIYGGAVLLWGLAAALTERVPGPEGFVELLVFAAVLFGSFAAYRKARQQSHWDTNALRVEELFEHGLDRDGAATRNVLRFELFAKTSIPQPNRIRLWFTEKPEEFKVMPFTVPESITQPRLRGNERVIGEDGYGRVLVKGKRLDIKYIAPPLDKDRESLWIHVMADSPIELVKSAAFCPRGRT